MIDGMERIGVHLPSLIVYSVNFAILTGVLYLLAFRPMLAGIRRRTEEREAAEALLRTSEIDVARQHTEALAALEEARQEARQIVSDAMVRARGEARDAVERGLEQAQSRSAADLHAQRERVHAEGAALAVAGAARVLREALGPETQGALVAAALREIAETQIAAPEAEPALVTVTSAVALTSTEWAQVGEALRMLVGSYAAAVHHVRPEVLGGLAVEVGDTVIDATVLGKLHQLHDELAQAEPDSPG
jgi:F0F1-type ATP synthase membrane subunit b/b'